MKGFADFRWFFVDSYAGEGRPGSWYNHHRTHGCGSGRKPANPGS